MIRLMETLLYLALGKANPKRINIYFCANRSNKISKVKTETCAIFMIS